MSFQSNGGGALFTGTVSYALVHNGNGQTFAPNVVTPYAQTLFTIDTVDHLSSDFTASVGGTQLIATQPGLYLVAADAYAFSSALTSGRITTNCAGSVSVPVPFLFVYKAACDAINSDQDQALDVRVFVVTAPNTAFSWGAVQTDTVSQVLGGDLFAVRLGDIPA